MGSCKPHDYILLRFPIDPDPKSCQISQKNTSIRLGDPLPPFVNNKDVADLKPPKTRDDSFFRSHSDECVIGSGVLLILKCPAGGNRCIEHERHQYLRPLWFSKTSKCLSGRQLYFLHNSLSRCSFFLRHCSPLSLRSCARALPWSWRTWPYGINSACCSGPRESALG